MLVAHRLSTVRDANKICVLGDGTLVPWPTTHPQSRQLRQRLVANQTIGGGATVAEVELHAGDALFVPPGWLHEVRAVERLALLVRPQPDHVGHVLVKLLPVHDRHVELALVPSLPR